MPTIPRSIVTPVTLFLTTILVTLSGCAHTDRYGSPPVGAEPERAFRVTYVATLSELKPGAELDLWIPVPHDDAQQRITRLDWSGPLDGVKRSDPVHGNTMLHFSGAVTSPTMDFTVTYEVDRFRYAVDLQAFAVDAPESATWDLYLEPSSLAFANAQVEMEAATLNTGEAGTLAQGRRFYDHVLSSMSYDKQHSGWGRGSIEHACSVGKGNCTDFHSYFTALCLARGIPSRFQIGIYGKYDVVEGEYETGGYHCWAEFHVPGRGWVPVDISEADKDPAQAEFFFGSHTSNRVTLSTGRDLILAPPQAGPPLNFFIYPYAEVNGVPLPKEQVRKVSRWKDLPPS